MEGRTYWFSDEGAHYKLRTDSDVADLAAAAEAAAIAAHDAQLAAEAAAAGAGVTDGDKGNIVVSGSGSQWDVKAGSIDNSKVATPATEADGIQATKLTFEFEYAAGQSVYRSAARVIREAPYNLRTMFPIAGNGIADETVAFNQALEKCFQDKRALYIPAGRYPVRESGAEVSTGNKRCLLNRGVSMLGESANNTRIVPFGAVSSDVDFLHVIPEVGEFNDFVRLSEFAIWPGYPNFSTSIQGKRCIWIVTQPADINVAKFELRRTYLFPSSDWSLHCENNPTTLPQGNPSNSLIADNAFWGGMSMSNAGDSNVIARNIIRTAANGRRGIEFLAVNAGLGSAGHNIIEDNNIDCAGGGVFARGGRHIIINRNNIEQSTGPGTSVGAVIDVRGDIQRLDMPVITNNVSAIFGSSTAQRALAITNCDGAFIHGNKFDTDSPRGQGMWNRGGAVGSLFGVNLVTSAWATKFTDEGSGTRSWSLSNGYTP